MSEARLAERLARNGATMRYAHGRYWRRMKRGFYAPLHWLARMDPQEARRPRGSWGFVAGLHARHAASANAAIPVHVLTNLADFRTADIPKDTRRAYRRIEERGIRIVHVTDDEVFRDQGYGVLQDWRERKGLRPVPREEFMADCEEWVEDEAWVVAAAMQEDELLGYASAWAVEHASFLRTYAFLKRTLHAGLRLSSVLNFALVSVLQRTDRSRRSPRASPNRSTPA